MQEPKRKKKPVKQKDQKLSLRGIPFEQAVGALLRTPPPPKWKK